MIDANRPGTIAAFTALTAAALLFVAAIARALILEPADAPAPPPTVEPQLPAAGPVAEPRVPSEATLSALDLTLAVDNDPFQPDRARPEPYRLPGEEPQAVSLPAELPPAPDFRVVGTIVAGDGGLAVIALADSQPRVLGLGESLLGYRLERVGATSATMVGSDRTIELSLASATPQAASAAAGRSRGGQEAGPAATGAEMMRALQMRGGAIAQQVQELQRAGASQEQIQAFIRDQLQRATAGGRGGGNVRIIRRDTLGVPLRAPDNR